MLLLMGEVNLHTSDTALARFIISSMKSDKPHFFCPCVGHSPFALTQM
jgi:hypothetical protein